MTEPDYSIHLIRAERSLGMVYPAMCERKVKEAVKHALEAMNEIGAFVMWVLQNKAKG